MGKAVAATGPIRNLDQILSFAAHQAYCDVETDQKLKQDYPVGRLWADNSPIDFWQLRFPMGTVDFNKSEVVPILMKMLAVRTMDPCDVMALTIRIQSLGPKYGPEGYLIASTLLTRVRQALLTPDAFPGLLSDDELTHAYVRSKGISRSFTAPLTIQGAAKLPGLADKLPNYRSFANKFVQQVIDGLGKVQGVAEETVGKLEFFWLQMVVNAPLATGAAMFSREADAYKEEMVRRGLPDPK